MAATADVDGVLLWRRALGAVVLLIITLVAIALGLLAMFRLVARISGKKNAVVVADTNAVAVLVGVTAGQVFKAERGVLHTAIPRRTGAARRVTSVGAGAKSADGFLDGRAIAGVVDDGAGVSDQKPEKE